MNKINDNAVFVILYLFMRPALRTSFASIMAFLFIFLPIRPYAQAIPNYEETTVYNIDGKSTGNNSIGREYSDGLGRSLQTISKINSTTPAGYNAVVSATEYDDAGRPVRNVKPFAYANIESFALTFLTGMVSTGYAANYYNGAANHGPNAGGYPYSSTQYYPDPLNRAYATGAPGQAFSIDGGHVAKTWTFGVNLDHNGAMANYLRTDGFISTYYLMGNNLDNSISSAAAQDVADHVSENYLLTVTEDANGNFTQELKDLFGRTIRTWSISAMTASAAAAISSYTYDMLGNKLREQPPSDPNGSTVSPTCYSYNSRGQLLTKTSPDAGCVYYNYDDAGNISSLVNANLQGTGKCLYHAYDNMGRKLTTSINAPFETGTRLRTIFDDPSDAEIFLLNSAFPTGSFLEILLLGLTNTIGKPVATITYDEGFISDGTSVEADEANYTGKVIDLYSYDDEGRVIRKYKSIPGLPLQTLKYGYDFQGKLSADTLDVEGQSSEVVTAYSYDADGRLASISRNAITFVTYQYDELGNLVYKNFVKGASPKGSVSYTHNIRDWTTSIKTGEGNPQFEEDLAYDADFGTPTTATFGPQYNGNIGHCAVMNRQYGVSSQNANLSLYYSYDGMNRLSHITNDANSGTNYDASFAYLNDGRILQKHEGLYQASWGNYAYKIGTNQLVGIDGSTIGSGHYSDGTVTKVGTEQNPNYVYDNNGNMVLDRSKKMAIVCDWRDMPVRFLIYNTIPASVKTWSDVQSLSTTAGVALQTEVDMAYDASGKRVLKEVFDPTQDPASQVNATQALLVTDQATGATMLLDQNGNIQTARPASILSSVPSGALTLQEVGDGGSNTRLAFSGEMGIQTASTIQTRQDAISNSGALCFSETFTSITQLSIGSANGSIRVAGNYHKLGILSGVAYVDGVAVYKLNAQTCTFDLSYVNVSGDGHSLGFATFFKYFVKDHLGSTRLVINDGTNQTEVENYLAYGAKINCLTPAEGLVRESFTGKEMDEDGGIGLIYFGARYYDPVVGEWTACDRKSQFWNPYGYAGNGKNPIVYIDENGNWFGLDDLFAAAAGFVIGYVSAGLSGKGWGGRALMYGAIGAGAAWLAWNTGGASVAAGHLGFWGSVGLGATSGAVGGAFTGAATYTETAAWGKDGYSMSNLNQNWKTGQFFASTAIGAGTGAVSGAVSAAASYGLKSLFNATNSSRFDKPGLSREEQFIEDNKLERGPFDAFKSAPVTDKQIIDDAASQSYDNGFQRMVATSGNHPYWQVRFLGPNGLHISMEDVGKFAGHYDFWNPTTSFGNLVAHICLEVPFGTMAKTVSPYIINNAAYSILPAYLSTEKRNDE